MANQNLFQTLRGRLSRQTDAVNQEGGVAYQLSARQALAQYALTGCLNATFYASAETQLETVLNLCDRVTPEFVAQTAIYCREKGYMKDMPALLCARLSLEDSALLNRVFPRVIDNGKMLRNFVQIMRSGAVGRKSLGSRPKRLVQQWLAARSDEQIFRASVGQSPSLADIIRMVRPKPETASREALYGYLIGREYNPEALPELVRQYERFKTDIHAEMPEVPFQMLTSLKLRREDWQAIARNASWQMTRMNLNTFVRQGVFGGFWKDREMIDLIADRLRNPTLIARARVFPYQLMVAYLMAGGEVPSEVRNALQDAMEIAITNVPAVEGQVYVCPDVSASMTWAAATGQRKGATSKVRCIDIAALVTAAILRKNPQAEVLPFAEALRQVNLNPRDSVMTNASRLAQIGGGGTNCSAPLKWLNSRKAQGDLVVYVSDDQSWVDARAGRSGTAMMQEWNAFKQRNPQARLVCLDIQPYETRQTYDREDVLNIGGFSDNVFTVIAEFAAGRLNDDLWVREIEKVEL